METHTQEINKPFQSSESTSKLDKAMAIAQSHFSEAEKNKVNPYFKSKYADLSSIWKACREGLSKANVNVTQWLVDMGDDKIHVQTRIAHEGEWLMCRFSLPIGKKDAHGYGSASTYCKRFALAAALGISDSDDDDGNGSLPQPQQRPAPPQTRKEKATNPNREVTMNQLKMLFALNDKRGLKVDDLRVIIKKLFNKESTKSLTHSEFEKLLQLFNQNKDNEDLFAAAEVVISEWGQ